LLYTEWLDLRDQGLFAQRHEPVLVEKVDTVVEGAPRSGSEVPRVLHDDGGPQTPSRALQRRLLERHRGKGKKAAAPSEPSSPHEVPLRATLPEGADRAALRRRWAELIRRVYEVDPLVCPRCGGEMRVIGFITQPALIASSTTSAAARRSLARLCTP